MMYEGEDTNTIDLLFEAPTTERNGVKIIVPVEFKDRYDFPNKIKEQLCYFESVYFDVKDHNLDDVKIHRSENFQYSSICQDNDLHICLDNVYYPLDFSKLGIPRLAVKLGLRFGLSDGIFPTPNRESIRYTEEAKSKILDKLEKVADYIVTEYNSTIKDTEDVVAIIRHFSYYSRHIDFSFSSIPVDPISKYSKIKLADPNYKGMKYLTGSKINDLKYHFLNEYKIKASLYRKLFSYKKNVYGSINLTEDYNSYKISNTTIKENVKSYLKDILYYGVNYRFINKVKSFTLYPSKKDDDHCYFKVLNLHNYPKSEWREIIQEFNKIRDSYLSNIENIDDLVIPQEWLNANKKTRSVNSSSGRKKAVGEVNIKSAQPLLKYNDNKDCKFVSEIIKLENFNKQKFHIYTNHENDSDLDGLYKIIQKQKIKLITMSKREEKLFKDFEFHNLIHYNDFMKGKNKPFRRLVTAHKIKQLLENNRWLTQDSSIMKISYSLWKDLEVLNEYVSKNYHHGNKNVYNAMSEVAENNDGYDKEIYYIYERVNNLLSGKLDFLNILVGKFRRDEQDQLMAITKDVCKRRKFRMNYKMYLPTSVKIEEEQQN